MMFTCSHCNMTSHNPNDLINRYCGWCHHFCDDVDFQRELDVQNRQDHPVEGSGKAGRLSP